MNRIGVRLTYYPAYAHPFDISCNFGRTREENLKICWNAMIAVCKKRLVLSPTKDDYKNGNLRVEFYSES